MPRKYTRKPRRVARKGGKRKSPYTKGGSGLVSAIKSLTVPDRLLLKLPYYADVSLKSSSGSYIWNWNLNSIYDPDRTGGGHQPMGYDQWGIFFNRYRVYGVQFDTTFTNMGATPVRVFNLAGNEAPIYQDETLFEQSHVRSLQLAPIGSGKDTMRIRKFYSLPRIMGRSSTMYRGDDRTGSQWNNNPLEALIGTIGAKTLGENLDLDVLASVRIVFLVEAFDKHPMAISNTAPEARVGVDGGKDTYTSGPTGPTGPTGPSGLLELIK